ncbi:MAG: hypothetical protein WD341_00965 [Tistlia sp.]|uniref:hypothetical protein n=1 Tax=Tistlia sp. TaxID=3057121 RepID=UPI0034A3431B
MPAPEAHERLLLGFYRRTPPAAVVGRDDEARWWIESDRRVLDVSRLCWRFWPLTCALGCAFAGPDSLLQVAARLPEVRRRAPDVDNAVRLSLLEWCREAEPPYLAELHAYESATRDLADGLRPATDAERARLPLEEPDQAAWCLDTTIDLPVYLRALGHYARLNAPPALIRALDPPACPGWLAFWRREGTMRMADLGNRADRSDSR